MVPSESASRSMNTKRIKRLESLRNYPTIPDIGMRREEARGMNKSFI